MEKIYIDDYLKIPAINTKKIYHYTSAAGLKGIVGREFWITDSEFLNDKTEMTVGNEIITEIIEEKISDVKLRRKLIRLIENEIRGFLKTKSDRRLYVLSCSYDADSLIMWSEYSAFMGYCMEFEYDQFKENFVKVIGNNTIFMQGCVVYDHDQQKKILLQFIDDVIFDPENGEDWWNSWDELKDGDEEEINLFVGAVSMACFLCNMFYKYSCFEQEHECRVVIWGDDDDLKKLGIKKDYKLKSEVIIPFIKVPIKKTLGLSKVIVGPVNNSDIAEKGVKMYLDDNKIKARVEKSRAPLRY